jgi:hypothetical protein
MIRQILLLGICAVAAVTSGCATIVHGGPRSIPISSSPPGATVSIYDRSNQLVMTNTTPFVAKLDVKYGYFRSQTYRLDFELAGHPSASATLDSKVSGWYWANLVFGGLIGMLIVDPLTGAMFNLAPDNIEQTMSAPQASNH